jgi:hypothetical protein
MAAKAIFGFVERHGVVICKPVGGCHARYPRPDDGDPLSCLHALSCHESVCPVTSVTHDPPWRMTLHPNEAICAA